MEESPQRRGTGIGYPGPMTLLLVWTVVGALSYGRHYLDNHSSGPPASVLYEFLSWQTCFLPWVGLSSIVFRLERKWPLGTVKWPLHVIRLIIAGVPLAYTGLVLGRVFDVALAWAFHRPLDEARTWWKPQLSGLAVVLLIYFSVVVAAYVIRTLISLRQRELEAADLALQKAELESSLRHAELEALRSRLNPHFLFNCLQNISVLTREDPVKASQMLTRLGDLLRAALRSNTGPETTLGSEISLTQRYVEVERIRFGDRLSVMFDVSPETESSLVPTFVLQPLVENAIVHGLCDVEQGGIITVRSRSDSGSLVISIADNGNGLCGNGEKLDTRIGLGLTCERLARMYSDQHSFSIHSLPEGGTEVRIVLPIRQKSASSGAAAHEQAAFVDRR